MINGINHINISVADIERSFLFYKDILGFKPLCKSEGSAYFLAGNPDGSSLKEKRENKANKRNFDILA